MARIQRYIILSARTLRAGARRVLFTRLGPKGSLVFFESMDHVPLGNGRLGGDNVDNRL